MNPRLRPTKFTLAAVAVFVCLFALASPVQAQLTRTREPPQNVPSLGNPDAQVRALEIEAARKRDPNVVMNEINEDFKRLNAINGELKNSIAATDAVNYKNVSEVSTELKKRAMRLRANLLALPRTEKDPKAPKAKDPNDPAQFKAALTSLSNSVNSFLTNPLFSDTGAPDMQLAVKAGNDLDQIIELSEKTKKGAEKLNKVAGKSR